MGRPRRRHHNAVRAAAAALAAQLVWVGLVAPPAARAGMPVAEPAAPAGVTPSGGTGTDASEAAPVAPAPVDVIGDAGVSFVEDPAVIALAEMDLEELMQVDVTTTATLTETERRLVPAAITTIDRPLIDYANARSLTELLDIYVPNFHYVYHMWEPTHWGARGIIADRDDKYLLLVNGRVMNERTHFGALAERDLVLLGDLRQVDVIRGPGSAVYGPGAVSMVVAQQTETGLTYDGTGVIARAGAFEEFYSLELKRGGQWDHDSGYFLYGGVAKYNGADHDHSPLIQGYDFDTVWGPARHGEPVPYRITDLHRTYEDDPQVKLHAQIDSDGFTLWGRYTRGGEQFTAHERGPWVEWPVGWFVPGEPHEIGAGYQQLTGFAGYRHPLTDALELDVSTSYDVTEYDRRLLDGIVDSYREEKSISRALLHWKPGGGHQVSGGAEYAYYRLGLPSWRRPGLGGQADRWFRLGEPTPEWSADMTSLVAEHQWQINDQWTTIVSGRADNHKFTDWLLSPRGAVAYSPTERDTVKFIASRSLRTNFEEEMKYEHDLTGTDDTEPEVMRTYELRYERQQNGNLFLAGSVFYNDLDVLGWNSAGTGGYSTLGSLQTLGAEVEASYRTGDTTITFSHGYVKLQDIELDPGVMTYLSAQPLGYGDDLANWPSHITKLTVHRQLNQQWSVDGSLRVQWSFPGDEDFLAYGNDNPENQNPWFPDHPDSVAGWDEPYGPSVFLNLGVQHRFNENLTLRFDAYNVLGWIDESLNKRDFLDSIWSGSYRAEAPALGLTLKAEF